MKKLLFHDEQNLSHTNCAAKDNVRQRYITRPPNMPCAQLTLSMSPSDTSAHLRRRANQADVPSSPSDDLLLPHSACSIVSPLHLCLWRHGCRNEEKHPSKKPNPCMAACSWTSIVNDTLGSTPKPRPQSNRTPNKHRNNVGCTALIDRTVVVQTTTVHITQSALLKVKNFQQGKSKMIR